MAKKKVDTGGDAPAEKKAVKKAAPAAKKPAAVKKAATPAKEKAGAPAKPAGTVTAPGPTTAPRR